MLYDEQLGCHCTAKPNWRLRMRTTEPLRERTGLFVCGLKAIITAQGEDVYTFKSYKHRHFSTNV